MRVKLPLGLISLGELSLELQVRFSVGRSCLRMKPGQRGNQKVVMGVRDNCGLYLNP